jgi:Fic family protein
LLITFILCAEQALKQPLLYLSLYFKSHRQDYYDALQRVRVRGEWEHWMDFYLSGVEEMSLQAAKTIQDLTTLYDSHRKQIQTAVTRAASALQLLDLFRLKVMLNLPAAERELELSYPTVSASMAKLEKLGIVKEMTGHKRNRIYAYMPFLKILNEGTQTPASAPTGTSRQQQ